MSDWWRVEDVDPYAVSKLDHPLFVLEDGLLACISRGAQALMPETPILDWVGRAVEDIDSPLASSVLCALWASFVRGESARSTTLELEGKLLLALLWPLDRKAGPPTAVVTFCDLGAQRLHDAECVQRAVRRMVGESEATATRLHSLEFVGNSPSLRKAWKRIRQVASLEIPVLLSGEAGTGKNVAALTLHKLSERRDGPLEALNCAMTPASLIESQLFGHRRGAFPGAESDRKGAFELAQGGTLFLDEITELDLAAQAKLLRVLDTGLLRPVGAEADRPLNVRLIAATNRDLRAEVEAGGFREDLYYRVRVFEIEVPPLRDRGDDVALLANHFAQQIARERGRPLARFEPAALKRLLDCEWPGNVRQLRNAVEFALVSAGDTIQLSDLPPELRINPSGERQPLTRERILAALKASGGKRVQAARSLGVSRVTLWKWIKRLKLDVEL